MKGKPLFILISLLAIFLTAAAAFAGDETAPSDEYEVPEPVYGDDYEIGDGVGYGKLAVRLFANSEYDGYKVCAYDYEGALADTKFGPADEDNTVILTKLINVYYDSETCIFSGYTIKAFGYKEINGTKYYSDCSTGIEIPWNLNSGSGYVELEPSAADHSVTAIWWDSVKTGTGTYKQVEHNNQIEVYISDSIIGDYSLACSGIGHCTIEGLSLNKVYYYRFRWLDETLNVYSSLSNPRYFVLKTPPDKTAPMIGNKKIRVYFEDDEALTGHQIKAYDTGTGKLVKTVNVKRTKNPTYADITGLKNGTEYRFDICSYTVNGKKTEYGEVSSVTATPQLKPLDSDVPPWHEEGYVSATGRKISVSFSTTETWTAGRYLELRRADNGVLVMSAYAPSPYTAYTFSGSKIEYNVPYLIRIWKYNEKSPKGTGNTYIERIVVPLEVPKILSIESGDGSLKVSWEYSGIADWVEIGYSTEKTKWSLCYHGCASDGSGSCTITGLDNGTLYFIVPFADYEFGEYGVGGSAVLYPTKFPSAMPLPVMNSATVTPGSKSLTVQYDKVDGVDGHIIQLYRMSGTKAKLVKTVTSTDKNDQVTVSFKGLSNNTTYRVCISAYKKYEKKVYRSAVATYDDIIPSANASAGKDLIGVSDLGESFNGFVDPLGELDSQTDTVF